MQHFLLRWLLLSLLACTLTQAAQAADPHKVFRTVIPSAESGFDPVAVHDLYSSQITASIFETLYTYDYLARPARLIPQTAAALPVISEDGKTWTIRLKRGIYFADDPAFGGKRRELTMADYVYSLKRLIDPALRSPWSWLVEGKIMGLDRLTINAKATGHFDYDSKVVGLKLLDPYTLRLRLTRPDYNLGHILAHTPTAAVAREVIETHRDANGHAMSHPVGTGPYQLTSWTRAAKMVLTANPAYRGFVWAFAPGDDPENQRIANNMKGKTMPQIGRVEISVIPEGQSRWLAFLNGEIDVLNLDGPLAPRAIEAGQLRPALAAKGIILSRQIEPELSHFYFNMRDPVLGGLTTEKIALRRAIAMAHNLDEEIAVVWNGQAVRLHYPIPPGVAGHDPAYRSSLRFDPKTANALLDKFGYKKGADGWRILPTGLPFTIRFTVRPDSTGQQQAEMWKKTFDALSIRMEADKRLFPDMLKAEKQCKLMMRTSPWIADYPDGDNFMQLFYGRNIGQSNHGCVHMAEYDAYYEQSRQLPNGPERNALYHKMARLLEVYAPTLIGYARYRNMLVQPEVVGYKKHPILHSEWIYLDMDKRR
jgi:ABC-type transport system substrate-binding protein